MVRQPASPSEIAQAFQRLAAEGINGLEPSQRRLLARVMVDEVQKGAFDPKGEAGNVLQRFITHGQVEFPADGTHMVVRDYRYKLRVHAVDLATETPPVTSLILYATAIEHWINAMIVTASVRAGLHELDALAVVKQFRFPDKLEWLKKRFGFPPFAETHRKAMQRLVDRRNEYVHYKWKGVSHAELEATDAETQQVVDGAGDILDYLEQYERDHLAGEAIDTAVALFGISRDDLARRSFRRTA